MGGQKGIIEDKCFDFAIRIVKLNSYLKKIKREYVISKQLLKAGTSIGANISEAVNGESKADFIHKLEIAQKEKEMKTFAKKFGLVLMIVCLMTGMAMGATIKLVTFETAGGYTTSITEFTDADTDYFIRTDGSNITGESFSNVLGRYYFAAQDIDGEGASLPVTLILNDVDISGYTSTSIRPLSM